MAEKQALCTIGHLEAGDPEALGLQMASLSRRFPHIDIFGGCCGTWDDHLRATAQAMAGASAR
jgi:methionine synthase I (cobalamin-dependent)